MIDARITSWQDAGQENMNYGYRMPRRASLWTLLLTVCLGACGGGGGGNSGGSNSPPSGPGPNRPPVIAAGNAEQIAVIGFPYDYDATKGGQLFQDPDGDALVYETKIAPDRCGLTLSGLRVTGVPSVWGSCSVTVIARDGRGGEATDSFLVLLRGNRPPSVVLPNANREVAALAPIDYDATQGGTTFADADGHALSYEVAILSAPSGFTVQGTRIVGMLSGPGFGKVKIAARDAYGGVAEDSFAFVVPAQIATRPTLPATPFVYEDAKLPLPDWQRPDRRPAADTTPSVNEITDAGATLGRVLFYDKRLSITNTHSCGSCHEQARNFASSQTFPTGCVGMPTKRSPMALANVRYNHQNRFFSDARSSPLEELTLLPILDRDELGSVSLENLERELNATDYYAPLFSAAFGNPTVTRDGIARALGQFLRSMISYQAKWDRAFLQVSPAPPPDPAMVLTSQEQYGWQRFNELHCTHCHDGPGFVSRGPENNGLDEVWSDPGAGEGRFRPAALQNIAVSGPYMHDGRFTTLRQVIGHYDSGVKNSPAVYWLLNRQLNLSEDDKAALEAFFATLTDNAFLSDPKFSDPFQ
jgi:cytochrome c peroxidase